MRAAKPVEPPQSASANAVKNRPLAQKSTGPQETVPGRPPILAAADLPKAQRIAPALEDPKATAAASGNEVDATIYSGLPFTTARVSPSGASASYPYATAGKLFFTEQGKGDFVCTAEVLRPRIVQTAGHCVAQPSPDPDVRHFFTNWVFVPGYDNGSAPYGRWPAGAVGTTNEWYGSDGSVPNAADIGELMMPDQFIDSTPYRIGDVVGYLGYRTDAVAGNHITQLGYPCNLDSCERMERNDAGNAVDNGFNTVVIGSAMSGGSSGGPWIQDFGVAPVSNPALPLALNYLVASNSYGPTGTQGYSGASVLGSAFLNLLDTMCALQAGNC